MINQEWTTGASNPSVINLRINISSYIDDSTISGKFIILKFRGRKTNFQRSCVAIPSNGSYSSPTYDNNSRYWTLTFKDYYPGADYTPGGSFNVDTSVKRLLGIMVLPSDEIYDITYWYNSSWATNLGTGSAAVEITGISSILNVRTDPAVFTANPGAAALSYYTEYTENDLSSVDMSADGLPASASVDNRDVQYGTETWTPNY
tara:strand:+ start:137 stop:748 length:612 start_codon:yes stop_codon:yes gene_type:complete